MFFILFFELKIYHKRSSKSFKSYNLPKRIRNMASATDRTKVYSVSNAMNKTSDASVLWVMGIMGHGKKFQSKAI